MVMIKILVLVFFVGVMLYYVSPKQMTSHWTPFQPTGWAGTFTGAAVVFFAYIGFDAVSTVAEETKNPAKDLPIGIIASLVICTVIYIAVAAIFTGAVPFSTLIHWTPGQLDKSLSVALSEVAPAAKWQNSVIDFGSVIAHTAVLLVFQLGQPRIFFSMARDGLLPPVFAKVHPKFKTPHVTTILTGVFVGGIAAFATVDEMVSLTNIGTLFAFILVCIGVIVLRFKDPDRLRPFRVPLGNWFLPGLGAVSCAFLIYYLPGGSYWRFVGWLMLGFAVYLSYGYARSTVGKSAGRLPHTTLPLALAAIGFLLVSIGLFTVPHESGLTAIFTMAASAAEKEHLRALIGLLLTGLGLVIGLAGLLVGTSRGTDQTES
jgi:APA family basic amino acid/polyamine antiporter